MRIGVLHPGKMGAALAGVLPGEVMWVSEGRSLETGARARSAGLEDAGSLDDLASLCEVVFSVCPPDAAVDVARSVAARDFTGLYVDANAIAPATARAVSLLFDRFVDAGIVGPPPQEAGDTRVYLSGAEAKTVAAWFQGTLFDARVIGDEPGRASALKMAYAGWSKGTTALLLAQSALAEANGVLGELVGEWDISIPGLSGRLESSAGRIGHKAWRFQGEMGEIAETLRLAGLPPGFHQAAGEIYGRLAGLKGRAGPASITEVVGLLLGEDGLSEEGAP